MKEKNLYRKLQAFWALRYQWSLEGATEETVMRYMEKAGFTKEEIAKACKTYKDA